MSSVESIVLGKRTAPPQFDGPQPATVLKVIGSDLYVELEAVDGLEVGPCAWSRPAGHFHTNPEGGSTGTVSASTPPAGTRCLVVFAGAGVTDPWVIGWDGWPS